MTRVEIKGFKSIAKKTVLTFPGAITCIAGPNGCGKSNVIDAIRWALGEQSARAMRAGAMGDVIFSGTQDVPGSGMAGVTLEFARVGGAFPKELDGFNEFSIARRLFRSGESIYTINDVKCRLKDVTDLFLDTGLDRQGYAIIEQGKIKDIILAKPEDIRHILEEVAEVGRFRVRRTDAIKRLEASQVNLDRIKDLLSEVGKQRDALKSQAGKARRYQVLKDKINGLTQLVWALEIDTIKGRKSSLDGDVATIEKGIQGVQEGYVEQTERLAAINTQVAGVKEAMDATNAALQAARARREVARGEKEAGELRLADGRSTIAMLSERMRTAQEENVGALSEIESCTGELERLGCEIGAVEEEYGRRKESVDACQAEFGAVAGAYDQKRAVLFEQIGHTRAAEQRIGFLTQRQAEVAANIAKRRQELAEMDDEEARLLAELAALDADDLAREEIMRAKQEDLKRLGAERSAVQVAFEKDAQQLITQEKRHTELATKIAMLDRIVNRTPPGAQGAEGNGFKRVSDALAVHPGFEGAAGSFGDVLDYFIINDHADVIGPEGVRTKGPGFVPAQPHLNGDRDDAAPQGEGLLGPLRAYVEAGNGYEAVREALTRGKWVVEDMPRAVRIWREGHRAHTLVTRDGMVLESSGIVRTSPDKEKYAEILKAKAERAALADEKQTLEGVLAGIKTALNEAKGRIAELARAMDGAAAEIRAGEREQEALKVKRQGIVSRRERMAERRKTFDQDIQSWEETARGMEQEALKALEEMQAFDALVEGLQTELKVLDEQKAEVKRKVDAQQSGLEEVGARLNGMKVACASREERLKGLKELLGRRYQEIENDRARIDELNGRQTEVTAALAATEAALAVAQNEIAALQARCEAYRPEYQAGLDQAQAVRTRIDELGGARAALEKQKQELLLGDKEQEIALKMLLERYTARFGPELPELPEGFDPDKAREESALYQTRIDGMGQINFASIESYEEAQARFDDLHRQYEDLVLAGTRLRELIANIERESTKEFMATFVKVRAHFQEIFTLMFGGGQADIVLQEGGGLDAGVDIFACPPFKRLKAMSLLSEGEKTLTAISFIFALFKVKPSPFCILDEVDAPLDDANVERFNRLIKTFARDSQFLVVTHNKNTMEIADIIYGVTFDVPGVTKVVSMDLQDTGT